MNRVPYQAKSLTTGGARRGTEYEMSEVCIHSLSGGRIRGGLSAEQAGSETCVKMATSGG